MKISQSGVDFIASFEGYHKALPDGRCTTYYCPAGVLTIGYGCTEGIKPGEVWTKKQALERFKKELTKHEKFVNDQTTHLTLNQAQYDMLVSFCYNCGPGALKTLLANRNMQQIGDALPRYNKGGGKVLAGLVRRRADERRIWMNGYAVETAKIVEESTSAEVMKQSSKLAWLGRAQQTIMGLFTGWGVGEYLGILERVKEYAFNYKTWVLVGAGVSLFLFFTWLKSKHEADYAEGNYTPSKVE